MENTAHVQHLVKKFIELNVWRMQTEPSET